MGAVTTVHCLKLVALQFAVVEMLEARKTTVQRLDSGARQPAAPQLAAVEALRHARRTSKVWSRQFCSLPPLSPRGAQDYKALGRTAAVR
jgi:hypothetical protein